MKTLIPAATRLCMASVVYLLLQAPVSAAQPAVSAGSSHTLSLKADGSLWGWGSNDSGQLGLGDKNNSPTPARIGTSPWKAVSAGSNHTVAIQADGTLWAWGANSAGQLGYSTTPQSYGLSPQSVDTSSTWASVSAGPTFSMAINSDGTLWTWGGRNEFGQSGLGTDQSIDPIPLTQVGEESDWTTVSTGSEHSLALKNDGTLWAWGYNVDGRLGDGTTDTARSPVRIGSDSNWVSIVAGSSFSFAIKSDGSLWAWGNNSGCRLGPCGTTITPTRISNTPDTWLQLMPGALSGHALALRRDGTLWAWGNNSHGQLGNGVSGGQTQIFSQIGFEKNWTGATAGGPHTIALKLNGSIFAWGSNDKNQLGYWTQNNADNPSPRLVTPLKLAGGPHHSLAVAPDGTLWVWGRSEYGELGLGALTRLAQVPTRLGSDSDWSTVSAGQHFSVALKSDGTLWAWGRDIGVLAGTTTETPAKIGQDSDWAEIAAGWDHVLALKNDGSMWAWGNNDRGQLGNETTFSSPLPVAIGSFATWLKIAAGNRFSGGIRSDGTPWAWGDNTLGQNGTGNASGYTTFPDNIDNTSNVTWHALAAGNGHMLGAKSDKNTLNHIDGWGQDHKGQLGQGSPTAEPVTRPIAIGPFGPDTGMVHVAAGADHSFALHQDGTLWGWGYNDSGQVGVGSPPDPESPRALSDVWAAVAAGSQHSLGQQEDGTLWAWGNGSDYQLGNDSMVSVNYPNNVSISPALYNISISSNNTAPSWATAGDTITLAFNSSIPIPPPSVTIAGHPAQVSGSGTSWSAAFTMGASDADGMVDFSIRYTDSLTGGSFPARTLPTNGSEVYFDRTPPVADAHFIAQVSEADNNITINAVLNQPYSLPANVHTSDTSNSAVTCHWSQQGGPAGAISFPNPDSCSTPLVSSTSDGSFILRLTATDRAGNSTYSYLTLIWDSTPPTFSSVHISSNDTFNSQYVTSGDTITLTFTTSEPIQAPSVLFFGGPVTSTGNGTNWSAQLVLNAANITSYPEGAVTFWIQAADIAGNQASAQTTTDGSSILLDKMAPVISNVLFRSTNASQSHAKLGDTVNLTFSASETILTPTVTIAGHPVVPASTGNNWTASHVMTTDDPEGNVTFSIAQVSDPVGHVNAGPTDTTFNNSTVTFDKTNPAVAISLPLDHSSLEVVEGISGSASDIGTGAALVEIQISKNGSTTCYYPSTATTMTFGTCPRWFSAVGTTSWAAPDAITDITPKLTNSTYTITARVTDLAGNTSTTTSSFTKVPYLYADPSTLTMDRSSTNIPSGNTMTVSGILSRYCSSGSCNPINLTNRKITISTKKDGVAFGPPIDVFTTDIDGHYVSPDLGPFILQGSYSIEAKYAGEPDLQSSPTIVKSLQVGKPAGYAIIIEGKLNEDPDGIPSHTKSARRAYMALKERDFDVANIYWFNQGPATDPANGDAPLPVNDTAPTAASIGKLFNGTTPFSGNQTLASLMNVNPAPIYLIMIDHGSREKFHLGDENITPATINSWLQNLDTAMNDNGKAEKKVIIIGACYSGSFIQPLPGNPSISAPGRVIVTSASDGEQSFRGGYDEDNGVQSGEYFLDEFFASLKRFSSIRTAFSEAAEKTWRYTRKNFEPFTSAAPFVGAAQHPLLDDNGDKVGSFLLTDAAGGDGSVSANLYLGASPGVNSVGDPTDLSQVASTIYIEAGNSILPSPLWATTGNNPQVSSVWVELLRPSIELSGNGSSIQITRLADPGDRRALNAVNGHFEYNGFTFAAPNKPGRYEATYYAIDSLTGNPSPSKRTVVYLDYAQNDTPVAPALVEPNAGGLIQNPDPLSPNPWIAPNTKILFRWSPGSDNHAITYKLEVCTNDQFTQNCFVKDEIIETFYLAGKEAALLNTTTYYWRVWTVDAHGRKIESPSRTFTTSTENSLPGFIQGFVVNAATGVPLEGAMVTAGGSSAPTGSNGAFVLVRNEGSYSVSVSFSGFTSKSSNISVVSGASSNLTFSLSPVPVATCGASHTGSFDLAPASGLCNPGSASAVTGSGPWNWTCTNGGATANCSASINSYPLAVTYAGNGGSGSINSDPAGINCTDNVCPSASYTYGKVVKLTGVPDSQSIFGDWTGNCIIDVGGNCDVTMNGAQNVAVAFNIKPPIWLGGAVYPATLADAFFAAANLVTIKTKATTISVPTGDVTYNEADKTVTLKGGYDAGYSPVNSGYTTIEFTNGKLAVKGGILAVQQVIVKPKP